MGIRLPIPVIAKATMKTMIAEKIRFRRPEALIHFTMLILAQLPFSFIIMVKVPKLALFETDCSALLRFG